MNHLIQKIASIHFQKKVLEFCLQIKIELMKRFIILFLFVATLSAMAQNPICPPGLNIADPTARVWQDGKLYVYGSRDDNPKTYCSHDHWVLSTSDLIHWEYFPDAFNSKGPKDKVLYNESQLYAPDCMYKDGLYYLYYCQPGKSNNEGVATSASPTGPFEQAKIMNIPARFSQIDPGVFIDDDGQAYYTWGQFSAKMAKLKPNMTEIDSTSIVDSVITAKTHRFHEGNYMIKRKGIYYLVYAHNGRHGHPTCIGYSTSKSPMGPYVYGGVIIDNEGCNPGNHNNHGSIVEFKGKWYVFYHRSTHGSKMMRKACIEPIKFLADGSIPEVKMTSQGAGKPLDAFSEIEAERACLLSGNVRIETFSLDEKNLVNPTNNDQLAQIKNGDNAAYKSIDFGKGTSSFTVRVASGAGGGKMELRIDSLNGPVIGTFNFKTTGGWDQWETRAFKINKVSGVHELYFIFSGESDFLFNIDKFQFSKGGKAPCFILKNNCIK